LLWNVDAVISFFSSVGYEAAGRGIGVAALSQSPFSKAMRYDVPETINEINSLVELLLEQTKDLNREDLRKAFRFIYAYIYRLPVQFRSFGIKNTVELDLRIQNTEQLADGFDPELDRICRCLLEQSPVLKTSNIDDKAAPHQDEEVFFDDYIALFIERGNMSGQSQKYTQNLVWSRTSPLLRWNHHRSKELGLRRYGTIALDTKN